MINPLILLAFVGVFIFAETIADEDTLGIIGLGILLCLLYIF